MSEFSDKNSGNQMERATQLRGIEDFSKTLILSAKSMYELFKDGQGWGRQAGLVCIRWVIRQRKYGVCWLVLPFFKLPEKMF